MEFGILGPLEVHHRGVRLAVRGHKVRTLLAALVVHAGRVLSRDRLLEILWGPQPPEAAPATLQSHVAHLRSALEPGRKRSDAGIVVTRDPGYVLDVDPATDVDAGRFERLTTEGRQALLSGDADEASIQLRRALALWRGEALVEFTFEPFAQLEIARLTELRLAALEDRVDADLTLGEHGKLVTELRSLVTEHPLRERFWGQLMLALYRSGRQADALRAYGELRGILGDQLGIEPGPELARLEECILLQKPELDLPHAAPRRSRAPSFSPAPAAAGEWPPLDAPAEEGLQAGRLAWQRRAWDEAFQLLGTAEAKGILSPADYGMLADAAFWSGRPADFIRIYERVHAYCLAADDARNAAVAALMVALAHAFRLRIAVAGGWFAVAGQLLEGQAEGVEHGYMEWASGTVLIVMGTDDPSVVLDHASRILASAERFGDPHLRAVGLTYRGYVLVHQGLTDEGLPLLDEAMASAVAGGLSPLATAAVICRTLSACVDLHDYRRAEEWLRAVEQSSHDHGLVGFPGDCRMHQAQVLLARGAWSEAELRARQACGEMDDYVREHVGLAFYVLGEVLRLRGDLAGADDAYARADDLGKSPQPGLGLLHLARGDATSALASLRQALQLESWNVLARARLLAAYVEIALAAEDPAAASEAASQLRTLATRFSSAGLGASADYVEGVVALETGDGVRAVPLLRGSWLRWREMGVTYEAARARLSLGSALVAVGDPTAGRLEQQAALVTFEQLGAKPDADHARHLLGELGQGRSTDDPARSASSV